MWDESKYIAFDFETSGILPEYALQPWRIPYGQAWATSLVTVRKQGRSLQVGGGLCVGEAAGSPKTYIRAMLAQAIEERLTLVAWNAAFDISVMIAYGFYDLVVQCNFLDGMLLWKHLTIEPEYDTAREKKFSYGLKAAVAQHMPAHAGYEEDVDFHATDPESLAKLHTYNIRDSAFTLRLTQRFYTALAADPARLNAALVEARSLPLIAWANWHGIRLDRGALSTLDDALTQEAASALALLEPHGVTEKIVRSPKQLSALMYEQWGLPVLKQNTSKLTGKTTDSTDKEVLHELAFIDPRAKSLRQYREALTNKTKFVDAPQKSIDYNSDGRSHPLAMVFVSYTGRVSYSSTQGKNKDARQIGFALHQEKREARFRDIAVPPEGYTLVEFDAAGQEYRWMAIASGDLAMQHLCMPGQDPHAYMGAQIAREDYDTLKAANAAGDKLAKQQRQLGKVANLSCIAEGTLVLSNQGVVPIERLPADALVWDGADWVRHGGVVLQGVREVITYAGLTATSDHLVLCGDTWVPFSAAARHGWRIESTMGADRSSRETQGVANTKTAVRVYDILDCGPNNRFTANGLIVHNCGYRTSAAKLRTVARVQYNLPMELPEATHIRATYLQTYTGVPRYWAAQIARVRKLGYAETLAGRRVQITGSWAGTGAWARESTAINYPIQGTGADQKYLALAVLRPYIQRHGIYFAWELHDGLYFYVPTNYVGKAIADMGYLLDNLPYTKAWGFTPPIPLPWDCKVSDKSWGQLKEINR